MIIQQDRPPSYDFIFLVEETLVSWDSQIQSICTQVNTIVDMIGKAQPDWLAKTSTKINSQPTWVLIPWNKKTRL